MERAEDMWHRHLFIGVGLAVWFLQGPYAVGQLLSTTARKVPNFARWEMESVEMRDGRHLEGLIESESNAWVNLKQVRQPPGRPMFVVVRPLERSTVAKTVRLSEPQRQELAAKLHRFASQRTIERGRADVIRLRVYTEPDRHYLGYPGQWFRLESDLDEALTRLVAVRLEQMFTAYRDILAPRVESKRPLRLVIFGRMDDYRAYLRRYQLDVPNPACFIASANVVVAGSELLRLDIEYKRIAVEHDNINEELKSLEQEQGDRLVIAGQQLREHGVASPVIKRQMAAIRRDFDTRIKKKADELKLCNRKNHEVFQQATRQMFVRLYHEAFHAYLENYVFPQADHEVPLWLNEGLAVMFEEGLLESDTLRVDAPNRSALRRLQEDLRSDHPLPLRQILNAGSQAFMHNDDAAHYYAYSWGLVYCLAFESRLLDSPALEKLVAKNQRDVDPAERFEQLVGIPLDEFELQWRSYILALK